MPDIDTDYEAVNAVNSKLRSESPAIVADLQRVQGQVAELLTSNGGLWLQKASPVFSTQYAEFTTSLANGVASMEKFAELFQSIVKNLQSMDDALSKPQPKEN
jgi:hypothetical protein